jgi:hypothetical protein
MEGIENLSRDVRLATMIFCSSGLLQMDVRFGADFIADYLCRHPLPATTPIAGVYYEHHPDWPKYLALNGGVAAATFASIIALAFLIPMLVRGSAFLIRRYWKWLNA